MPLMWAAALASLILCPLAQHSSARTQPCVYVCVCAGAHLPSCRECLQAGSTFYKRIFLGSWAAEAVTASPPGLTVKKAGPCPLRIPSPHLSLSAGAASSL